MTVDANDLALFAHIADAGGFARGAARAGLPKSTVSRRIASLETRLGERLFLRSTRKLTLTEFGAGLLDHARRMVEEVEAAQAFALYRQGSPSGRLRVSMPGDFAMLLLPGMLAEFSRRHPKVELELDLSPRRVDLVGEGFDLAIRMGDLPDDATLVARRLCFVSNGLFAAPAYLAGRTAPVHPDDLKDHACLGVLGRDGLALPWELSHDGQVWRQRPPVRVMANSMGALVGLAEAGAGAAILAEPFVLPALARGDLVRLLPDWSCPVVTAWAVVPGRRLLPAKTRAFLDMLTEALAGPVVAPGCCG
jgi:DNA-binding transcriptional LysR family regulator